MDRNDKPLLRARGITKSFPGTIAVDDAHLDLYEGEVVGLVGQNGAGKSTLVGVLSGVYSHGTYSGTIEVADTVRHFESVRDAEREGVVLVSQELTVLVNLTIAENIFLNHEPSRWGYIDFDRMRDEATEYLQEFDIAADPTTPAGQLSVAKQQAVEISRALARNAKVLILDEPTAALTERETQQLFEEIHRLKGSGVSSIYISHRIDEVREIADRIVVMRNGRVVLEDREESLSSDQIVEAMVGGATTRAREREQAAPIEESRIELTGWSLRDVDRPDRWLLKDVNLSVKAGEIVGLFGAVGSGRTELLLSMYGAYPATVTGQMKIDGQPVGISHPRDAISRGLGLLTEDRKATGLIPNLSVQENITLSVLTDFSQWDVIQQEVAERAARKMVEDLGIECRSLDQLVSTLSGGNQQKVLVARALLAEPRVLLLDEPTRGIDVNAKVEIRNLLFQLAAEGMAILIVDSEGPELLEIADRVCVLRGGAIVEMFRAGEADPDQLVQAATGA